jgi:seryl-tRNA(Sec) selenium transferase
MDLQDLNDKDQKFLEKMRKTHAHFLDSVDGLPVAELEKALTLYSQHREDAEKGKRENKKLNDAKELVAELQAPFNDAINALKSKVRFIHLLMKFKSGELVKEVEEND